MSSHRAGAASAPLAQTGRMRANGGRAGRRASAAKQEDRHGGLADENAGHTGEAGSQAGRRGRRAVRRRLVVVQITHGPTAMPLHRRVTGNCRDRRPDQPRPWVCTPAPVMAGTPGGHGDGHPATSSSRSTPPDPSRSAPTGRGGGWTRHREPPAPRDAEPPAPGRRQRPLGPRRRERHHGRRPGAGTRHAPRRGRARRTAPAVPRARGAVGRFRTPHGPHRGSGTATDSTLTPSQHEPIAAIFNPTSHSPVPGVASAPSSDTPGTSGRR